MVLDPPASGLLCPILRTSNSGSTTRRGFVPLTTPNSGAFGATMSACAIEPRAVLPLLTAAEIRTVGGVYSAAAC